MVSLSSFVRPAASFAKFRSLLQSPVCRNAMQSQLRHHQMPVSPSRFQWKKLKDSLQFYVLTGALPVSGIVLYANSFASPAQRTETPEDCVSKHWDYHKVGLWCLNNE